ncbi:hypothetical protein J3A84_05570 [Proteiniclasticum sp. SCR006]|uniref:Uncharacterized protein n=1 Tax=Proteiniclasticum aestuarii TaxID=2817862 RepID=A0A939KIU5_9CLOT|nr:hypothetical protein [Proteiniclasticum aestuarii]MBO1264508.1 hypothetical protein [Proteiniclasticum aestuarii]
MKKRILITVIVTIIITFSIFYLLGYGFLSPSAEQATASLNNQSKGYKINENLYHIKLEEVIRETEPTEIIIDVPEFNINYSFFAEGTKMQTKYTYRRLMKGNVQKSYKIINEEVVTEMSPRYFFRGTLEGNDNKDFINLRMLELEREGETRLLEAKGPTPDFDKDNYWDESVLYLDGERIIEFEFGESRFLETPSLDFLLYYAEVLEVEMHVEEIKKAYETVVNNGNDYRSSEIIAGIKDGKFIIWFENVHSFFDSDFIEARLFKRMSKSTAFQEKYYPDPMVLYEKYKDAAIVRP